MANDIQAATAKIEKYLAERAKAGQLDPIDIHALHMGDEREAVLTTTSIRLILSANREMREALEPFARAADKLDGKWSADDWRWNDSVRSAVTVAHIRKARSALTTQRGGGG